MSYTQHTSSGQQAPPKPNSYRKGLSFVPNSMGRFSRDPILEMIRTAPKIPKGQYALSDHLSSTYESSSTVPLFDLDNIMKATGDERSKLVQSYGIALSKVGIIGVRADRLNGQHRQIFTEMGRYFHLPFEQKILDWKGPNHLEGYSYLGSEIGPKADLPDFKESFFIPKNFKNWPRGVSYNFSRTMTEYYNAMNEYSRILIQLITEYIGESQQEQSRILHHAPNLLQLGYYPAIKPGVSPKGVWSFPRKNRTILTLLTPGTTPGLQYYSNQGHWQPLAVPQGYLIIVPGLLLEHKTAGLFKARWHSVVNPGGKHTRFERLSTAFHALWPEGYPLTPFSNCVEHITKGMTPRRKASFLKRFAEI